MCSHIPNLHSNNFHNVHSLVGFNFIIVKSIIPGSGVWGWTCQTQAECVRMCPCASHFTTLLCVCWDDRAEVWPAWCRHHYCQQGLETVDKKKVYWLLIGCNTEQHAMLSTDWWGCALHSFVDLLQGFVNLIFLQRIDLIILENVLLHCSTDSVDLDQFGTDWRPVHQI